MNRHNGSCKYLLPIEHIDLNVYLFMNLVNASSSHLQKSLTKEVINNGAKMFLYLNSCPYDQAKANIYTFFLQVFKKYLYEPTNSGMILYTLNAMKLFSNDGRIIASKILQKISTLFELTLIQSWKDHLTRKASKSMFMQSFSPLIIGIVFQTERNTIKQQTIQFIFWTEKETFLHLPLFHFVHLAMT